jgi:uncharacterized protein (DUF983 family)
MSKRKERFSKLIKIPEVCPECNKGNLKRELLKIRILVKCNNCDYSRFEKPNKK